MADYLDTDWRPSKCPVCGGWREAAAKPVCRNPKCQDTAIAALPAQGVRVTDAQIDAALDAMEIQFGFDGVENSIPWRQDHPDEQRILRNATRAGILAALATASGGVELETCGKCMGSGYGGHPLEQAQQTLDRHVLQHMEEWRDWGYARHEYAFSLRCFVNDWVTKDMARAICRSLTDRGFAFYMRGLWSDDGEPGGAGYGITDKGAAYLDTLCAGDAAILRAMEGRE